MAGDLSHTVISHDGSLVITASGDIPFLLFEPEAG